MYAVIETGGKQYRVEVGTELEVELLEAEPGDAITLDRVLLVADGDTASIGRPLVENASVAAEVVDRHRGDKVISFKYRPKARRRVKKGHRQELTLLRISDIVLGGRSAAADAKKAAEAKITERQRLEEAARRQAEADAALAAKLKPAAPKADAAAKPTKDATSGKTEAGTKAAKAVKAAPAKADASTKSTKPRAAKASASEGDAPAEKPKRSRTPKKDE
ncbi:MAG TPA: 50S ribosomal protein L21 [Candidatus Limnocylindrales bacterium]|nr:50S ribosomal protein L21 [Candidatus Limnocylindrales bacterium]